MKTPKASSLSSNCQHAHTVPHSKGNVTVHSFTDGAAHCRQGHSYYRRDGLLGHIYSFLIIFCAFVHIFILWITEDYQMIYRGCVLFNPEPSLLQHFLDKENLYYSVSTLMYQLSFWSFYCLLFKHISVTLEGVSMNMDWEQLLTVILHNYTLSSAAVNFN